MNEFFKKMSRFEGFEHDWRRLISQGLFILLSGILLALAGTINSDAIILSARGFSWLPVSGLFIFLLGLMEFVQSFLAKHQRDSVQNLQVEVVTS